MLDSVRAGVRCWVIDPNPKQEPLAAARAAVVASLLGNNDIEKANDPGRPGVGVEGDGNASCGIVQGPVPRKHMPDSRITCQEIGQPRRSWTVPAAGARNFASDDQPARA